MQYRFMLPTMFTGIINDVGEVLQTGADGTYVIKTSFDLAMEPLGASIACDGCCLTLTEKTADTFSVQVSPETKNVTTLTHWKTGRRVNLESALKVGGSLSGHMMTGHVDGLATLLKSNPSGENHALTFAVPENLQRFIAVKGSVALNGISLTVNQVNGSEFCVNIIPHTWAHTNLSQLKIGDVVNLEIDTIARYLDRLIQERRA